MTSEDAFDPRQQLCRLIEAMLATPNDPAGAPSFLEWGKRFDKVDSELVSAVAKDVFDILCEAPRFWFEPDEYNLLELGKAALELKGADEMDTLACYRQLRRLPPAYDVAQALEACALERSAMRGTA